MPKLLALVFSLLVAFQAFSDDYMGYRGEWVEVDATAYSPYDNIDQWHWSSQDEITANGRNWVQHPYGIAVPYRHGKPLFLPYGSRVIIPRGDGYVDQRENRVFVCDDTGSAITRKTRRGRLTIDLRLRSESAAWSFAGERGTKRMRIFVIHGVSQPPVPASPPVNASVVQLRKTPSIQTLAGIGNCLRRPSVSLPIMKQELAVSIIDSDDFSIRVIFSLVICVIGAIAILAILRRRYAL